MKIIIFHKKIAYIIFCLLFIFSIILFSTLSIQAYSSFATSNILNKVNYLTSGDELHCYLTFDDGPSPYVTPKILDILKEEDVKATFFVIGKSVETYPEIVKRAYEEGHFIANHGYSHNNTILYKNFEEEIKKTDLTISKAIGLNNYCSHVFRFPNGFMSPIYKEEKNNAVSKLSKMNYTYIDWNCLNNDSMKKYSSSQLLNNLKQSCKNKKTLVVLMHDTKDVSDSSLALKDSILFLKSQGYTFKNFYDL